LLIAPSHSIVTPPPGISCIPASLICVNSPALAESKNFPGETILLAFKFAAVKLTPPETINFLLSDGSNNALAPNAVKSLIDVVATCSTL